MRLQTDDGYILSVWPIYPIHTHGTAGVVLKIRLPYLDAVSFGEWFDIVCMQTGIRWILG